MDLFNRKALAVMKAAMESWRSQAETAWKTIATQNEAYDRRLATATLKLKPRQGLITCSLNWPQKSG